MKKLLAVLVLTGCGASTPAAGPSRDKLLGYVNDRVGWTKIEAGEASEAVREYLCGST